MFACMYTWTHVFLLASCLCACERDGWRACGYEGMRERAYFLACVYGCVDVRINTKAFQHSIVHTHTKQKKYIEVDTKSAPVKYRALAH